jgi:hypothetical protein
LRHSDKGRNLVKVARGCRSDSPRIGQGKSATTQFAGRLPHELGKQLTDSGGESKRAFGGPSIDGAEIVVA